MTDTLPVHYFDCAECMPAAATKLIVFVVGNGCLIHSVLLLFASSNSRTVKVGAKCLPFPALRAVGFGVWGVACFVGALSPGPIDVHLTNSVFRLLRQC